MSRKGVQIEKKIQFTQEFLSTLEDESLDVNNIRRGEWINKTQISYEFKLKL